MARDAHRALRAHVVFIGGGGGLVFIYLRLGEKPFCWCIFSARAYSVNREIWGYHASAQKPDKTTVQKWPQRSKTQMERELGDSRTAALDSRPASKSFGPCLPGARNGRLRVAR